MALPDMTILPRWVWPDCLNGPAEIARLTAGTWKKNILPPRECQEFAENFSWDGGQRPVPS